LLRKNIILFWEKAGGRWFEKNSLSGRLSTKKGILLSLSLQARKPIFVRAFLLAASTALYAVFSSQM
jgi:hypothetical protein